MDKNTWIGFGLIAAVIIGFSIFNKPSKEELAERQRVQDSINVVMLQEQKAKEISEAIAKQLLEEQKDTLTQEEQSIQLAALYGPFAPSSSAAPNFATSFEAAVIVRVVPSTVAFQPSGLDITTYSAIPSALS